MLNKLELRNLRRYVKKLLKDDYDKFDLFANIDNTLTYFENKRILHDIIKEQFKTDEKKKKREIDNPKEQLTEMKENLMIKEQQKAETEFYNCLEKIKNSESSVLLDEIFYTATHFSRMVALNYIKGFILFGECGLGKSFSVIKAFKDMKKDFAYFNGHITPLELYHILYENREKTIIFDDVNMLENPINLNMFKSCLNDDIRLVCYNTTSDKLRVPSKFNFEGNIIIILNEKPQNNENLKAVESRVLNYELRMDYHTKFKVLYELAKQDYKELTKEERVFIVDWLRENTTTATRNLNLRLLFQIYEIYRYNKTEWEKLSYELLENDEELVLIVQGLNCKEWCEETGKSRRTFYNKKKMLVQKCN